MMLIQVAAGYDERLAGYEAAAVRFEALSARLAAGQAAILAAGLTATLTAFAAAVAPGSGSAANMVRPHRSCPASAKSVISCSVRIGEVVAAAVA